MADSDGDALGVLLSSLQGAGETTEEGRWPSDQELC